MVKKKHYIRFYFHHDNHGEEPADIYGENTKYIIYIIFSPYMVNVVYTIHGENKRNLFFLPNSQKAFAFVEYGTRRCPSSSDRPVFWNAWFSINVSKIMIFLGKKHQNQRSRLHQGIHDVFVYNYV